MSLSDLVFVLFRNEPVAYTSNFLVAREALPPTASLIMRAALVAFASSLSLGGLAHVENLSCH